MTNASEFTLGVPTLGGALWIDLLNSRFVLPSGAIDSLADPQSFLRWKSAVGLGGDPPAVGEQEALVALREALEPAFDALARGVPLPELSLTVVNEALATRTTSQQLAIRAGVMVLDHRTLDTGPAIAATIAQDFAASAASGEKTRFKRCENPACSLVFYDRGRNNRRRWCSTTVCGNRDKVARYRARRMRAAPV